MPNMNVTYGDMESTAQRFKQYHAQITSDLNTLQAIATQLVSSGYVTDKSSPAFERAFTEFKNGAAKVMDGLNGMGTYLTTAHQALSETDAQLARSLGNG
jgi:WXG100 family type VII secretion target